jgi:hypothetical protein
MQRHSKRLRSIFSSATLIAIMIGLSGCATSLTASQTREYRGYESKGLIVSEKIPVAGAFLGILPGGGSFYARAYGAGVANLLTWPLSVLWDPVSGYVGSRTINYFATRADVETKMRSELSQLDDMLVTDQVSKEEYVRRKREVEAQYSPY